MADLSLEASVPVYVQGRVLLEACRVSTQHQGGFSCTPSACDGAERWSACCGGQTAAGSKEVMDGGLTRDTMDARFSFSKKKRKAIKN